MVFMIKKEIIITVEYHGVIYVNILLAVVVNAYNCCISNSVSDTTLYSLRVLGSL